MDALAELAHERSHHRRRLDDQPRFADPRSEREDAPAEAVGSRFRVALDEAVLVERLQRARELALVATDELGEAHDSQPVARSRVLRERAEDLEPTGETGGSGMHRLILAERVAILQLGVKIEAASRSS